MTVEATKDTVVISRKGGTNKLVILNEPVFKLKAFNDYEKKVLTLSGDRLLMENVNHFNDFVVQFENNLYFRRTQVKCLHLVLSLVLQRCTDSLITPGNWH